MDSYNEKMKNLRNIHENKKNKKNKKNYIKNAIILFCLLLNAFLLFWIIYPRVKTYIQRYLIESYFSAADEVFQEYFISDFLNKK